MVLFGFHDREAAQVIRSLPMKKVLYIGISSIDTPTHERQMTMRSTSDDLQLQSCSLTGSTREDYGAPFNLKRISFKAFTMIYKQPADGYTRQAQHVSSHTVKSILFVSRQVQTHGRF